jgi:hypothetical protein
MSKNTDLADQGDKATTAEMETGTETVAKGMSPADIAAAISSEKTLAQIQATALYF